VGQGYQVALPISEYDPMLLADQVGQKLYRYELSNRQFTDR
jgi:hypothetical protein